MAVVSRVVGGMAQRMDTGSAPQAAPAARRGSAAARVKRQRPDIEPSRAPVARPAPQTDFGFDVAGFPVAEDGAPTDGAAAAAPAGGDEDAPDFTGVLETTVDLGRELRGAKLRLASDYVADTPEYLAAKSEVDLLSCCLDTKIDKARTIEVPLLKSKVSYLLLNGIRIPKQNIQIYSSRIMAYDLDQEILTDNRSAAIIRWAARLEFGDLALEEQGAWDESDPGFMECAPCSEDEAVEQKFSQSFKEAFFCNAFVMAWKRSCEGGPGADLIVETCCVFLGEV